MAEPSTGPTFGENFEGVIAEPNDKAIESAAEALRRGDLVGMPTETVYGLAADGFNAEAVKKIFAAKGRPVNNPLILHAASESAARRLVDFSGREWLEHQWKTAAKFWPGPLTVVVPRDHSVLDLVTAGRDTVAIRVPAHPIARRLIECCGFALAAPSANLSNYISPTRPEHVASVFADKVAMVLDGGPCEEGLESTIILLGSSGPRWLRPGTISIEDLEAAFDIRVPGPDVLRTCHETTGKRTADDVRMLAPGMMPKHYAPRKPLVLLESDKAAPLPAAKAEKIFRILLSQDRQTSCDSNIVLKILSRTGDPNEIARELFNALREADASDCDRIEIEGCEEVGVGRAIMDRLRRAVGT
jgi:L-threonylcarbamoyladenylate synthase